jgi:hypothetical protein
VAYDPSIIAAIKRRAAQVEDPRKRNRYLRAALQIGIVESGLQNLNHGDADSKGWRQERQSLYKDPTNVKASVNRVFDEMAQHDQGQPMSTHYDLLTEGEQAHWDEYATLRSIADWAGFTEDQDERRADARGWLQEKRKEIWRLAQPAPDGDGKGWDHADRRERYETLKDSNLNSATVQRKETTLPAGTR